MIIYLKVALFIISIASVLYVNYKRGIMKKAWGILLKYDLDYDSDNNKVYKKVIEFKDSKGISHQFTDIFNLGWQTSQPGQKIEILYNPKNPKDAVINSFSSLYCIPIVIWIITLVFLISNN